jgi:hypothetical protein
MNFSPTLPTKLSDANLEYIIPRDDSTILRAQPGRRERIMTTQDQQDQAKALRAMSNLGVAYVSNTVHCPGCEILSHVMVPTLGAARWLEGLSIQDAMPELTTTQRETLISGLCFTCQAEIFTGEDEDPEETLAILADPETMEAIREAQAE